MTNFDINFKFKIIKINSSFESVLTYLTKKLANRNIKKNLS